MSQLEYSSVCAHMCINEQVWFRLLFSTSFNLNLVLNLLKISILEAFYHPLNMLGSKILGTNVLELQFVLCWQTMIKTLSLGLGLLKVCLFVKLESSVL